MVVRNYGLYDGVSKEVVRTFTSKNDESAIRTTEIMLRDPKTDRSQAKDFILLYLYSFDSSDGSIVDATRKELVALASIMPDHVDVDSAGIDEIKDLIKGLTARVGKLEGQTQGFSQALEAISLPIRNLDPALSQVHPIIDTKKGKILWVKK